MSKEKSTVACTHGKGLKCRICYPKPPEPQQPLNKHGNVIPPVAAPVDEQTAAQALYQTYCGERLSRGLSGPHWSCLSAALQEVWESMAKPKGYVRIRKLWERNSGWAQYQWLYYVDLVNDCGETARHVGVTCHAGEMNEYGMSEGKARAKAKEISAFFGWPIREFEEERTTTTALKEK